LLLCIACLIRDHYTSSQPAQRQQQDYELLYKDFLYSYQQYSRKLGYECASTHELRELLDGLLSTGLITLKTKQGKLIAGLGLPDYAKLLITAYIQINITYDTFKYVVTDHESLLCTTMEKHQRWQTLAANQAATMNEKSIDTEKPSKEDLKLREQEQNLILPFSG